MPRIKRVKPPVYQDVNIQINSHDPKSIITARIRTDRKTIPYTRSIIEFKNINNLDLPTELYKLKKKVYSDSVTSSPSTPMGYLTSLEALRMDVRNVVILNKKTKGRTISKKDNSEMTKPKSDVIDLSTPGPTFAPGLFREHLPTPFLFAETGFESRKNNTEMTSETQSDIFPNTSIFKDDNIDYQMVPLQITDNPVTAIIAKIKYNKTLDQCSISGFINTYNLYIPDELNNIVVPDNYCYKTLDDVVNTVDGIMNAYHRMFIQVGDGSDDWLQVCYKALPDTTGRMLIILLGIDNPNNVIQTLKIIGNPEDLINKLAQESMLFYSLIELKQFILTLYTIPKLKLEDFMVEHTNSEMATEIELKSVVAAMPNWFAVANGCVSHVSDKEIRVVFEKGMAGIYRFEHDDGFKYMTDLKLGDSFAKGDVLVRKVPLEPQVEDDQVSQIENTSEEPVVSETANNIIISINKDNNEMATETELKTNTTTMPDFLAIADGYVISVSNRVMCVMHEHGTQGTCPLGQCGDSIKYVTDLKPGDSFAKGDVLVRKVPLEPQVEDDQTPEATNELTEDSSPVLSPINKIDTILRSLEDRHCIVDMDALYLSQEPNSDSYTFRISQKDVRYRVNAGKDTDALLALDDMLIARYVNGQLPNNSGVMTGFHAYSHPEFQGYYLSTIIKESGFNIKAGLLPSEEGDVLALRISTLKEPDGGLLICANGTYTVAIGGEYVIHTGEHGFYGNPELLSFLRSKIFSVRKIDDRGVIYRTEVDWVKDKLKKGIIPNFTIFETTGEMVYRVLPMMRELNHRIDAAAKEVTENK